MEGNVTHTNTVRHNEHLHFWRWRPASCHTNFPREPVHYGRTNIGGCPEHRAGHPPQIFYKLYQERHRTNLGHQKLRGINPSWEADRTGVTQEPVQLDYTRNVNLNYCSESGTERGIWKTGAAFVQRENWQPRANRDKYKWNAIPCQEKK